MVSRRYRHLILILFAGTLLTSASLGCKDVEEARPKAQSKAQRSFVNYQALEKELNAVLKRDFADETTSDLGIKVEQGLVTLVGTVHSERYRDYLGNRMQQELLLFLKPKPGREKSVLFRNELVLDAEWNARVKDEFEEDEES